MSFDTVAYGTHRRKLNGFVLSSDAHGIVTGKPKGRLTLLGCHFQIPKQDRRLWFGVYKCECGRVLVLRSENVANMHTQSCGCFRNQQVGNANRRHGGSGRRLHRIWKGIKGRCYNERNSTYHHYGKLGITMCDEWISNYKAFRDWALANGYQDDLEIDRFPNQRGNYEPGNCRWATRTQQMRNTTVNRMLTIFSETKTMAEWAEDKRCVVRYWNVFDRLESGWSPEDAISTPKREQRMSYR